MPGAQVKLKDVLPKWNLNSPPAKMLHLLYCGFSPFSCKRVYLHPEIQIF